MKKLLTVFYALLCMWSNAAELTDTTNKISPDPKTIRVVKYNNADCTPSKTTSFTACPEEYISIQTDSNGINLAKANLDTFRLWMNGICYTNIKPLTFNSATSSLIFKLSLDTSKTSPWQLFYAWPNYWTFHHDVIINLGTRHKEFGRASCANKVGLNTTVPWMPYVGYPLFIIILVLIFRMGPGILRDTALHSQHGIKITYKKNEPTDKDKACINIKDVPFSLARFQFLYWLIIIFFGIIHIWVITDTLTTPTGTVLLLLGISGGTFYIGRLIDVKTDEPATPDEAAKAEAKAKADATKYVEDFINNNTKSKGFMPDVLTDGKSISLHRLQLVMFTVFLGFYFVWQVLYGLSLPQFSDTMMVLMGISSGMYAGVKTSEK